MVSLLKVLMLVFWVFLYSYSLFHPSAFFKRTASYQWPLELMLVGTHCEGLGVPCLWVVQSLLYFLSLRLFKCGSRTAVLHVGRTLTLTAAAPNPEAAVMRGVLLFLLYVLLSHFLFGFKLVLLWAMLALKWGIGQCSTTPPLPAELSTQTRLPFVDSWVFNKWS